ncbi:MAG: SpoIIE family protein phosphatase [Anaerolineae bacterium]|nr:SpoIIE family protein phosphatase [Phycisphaerae bacterium]
MTTAAVTTSIELPPGVIESRDSLVVLLVDDQAIVGHAIKQMLAPEADIQLHFCQDPAKAIAMANELHPTVILQDLVMPEIDGLTLLKFFRANAATRETPMIVLSSKEEPATKAQAFALGANDYLVKLPDRIELIARVRHHSRGYIAQLQRNEAYRKLAESEKKLADEVAQAAAYVRSLLPAPMTSEHVSIDWRFVPSTQLAGDAFGYRWLNDKHLAIYLLDVSGHGVGAALLAVSVLNVLTHSSLSNTDFSNPADVMRGLNAIFQMDRHGEKYFTIWYGVYSTDDRKLTFCGGGHPPPLLFEDAPTRVKPIDLETLGPPVGITDLLPFENSAIDVKAGAKILLYSDGAVEVDLPGDIVGSQEEFNAFIATQSSCDGIMDRIFERARAVPADGVLNDDCSLMLVDFQPPR